MIHKKSVLTAVLSLLFVSMMFASPVSKKTAEKAALNWMSYYSGKNVVSITVKNVVCTEYKGNNVLYIFTFKGGGFVIVAGDDQAYPILGYDTKSKTDMKNMPIQMKDWTEQYSKEINQIRIAKLTDKGAESEWKKILNNDFSAYEKDKYQYGPLILAMWHQKYQSSSKFWNKMCPYDPDGPGDRAYAGCVAVAMAQVMKKWNYPSQGNSQNGYYSDYGYEYANFGATYYYFSTMSNTSANYYVQKFLYHCGVSVEMDYDPDGSGAYMSKVEYALEHNFRYSTSASYKKKSSYTDDYWKAMIRSDVSYGKPLVYSGGSHAFNLDGAKTNDYFHFNFGWNGWWNGWFKLSSIKPAFGWYNFTSGQDGIFGIKPASKGEEKSETAENGILQVTDLVKNYPNPFNTETTIEYTLPETLDVSLKIYNITGQLVYTLVNEQKSEGKHAVQWNAKNNSGNKVAAGTYFYRIVAGAHTQTGKMLLME